jgi:hypothetical protein
MNTKYTVIVDGELAETLGKKRQSGHNNYNNTRRFFKNESEENVIGVKGEMAFAKIFGLKMDEEVRPDGDKSVDFVLQYPARDLSIDVKTARKPIYLFLKKKDAPGAADILVLAGIVDNTVRFLGWEKKSVVMEAPTKDFGYGIVNYYKHNTELRPMGALDELLKLKIGQRANFLDEKKI